MRELITNKGYRSLDQVNQFGRNFDPCQRAWVEVSPASIEKNAISLKRLLGDGCGLMAVVKADGYGHGAETVSRAAIRGGSTSLGVATLQEGIDLRQSGLDVPILLLGNLTKEEDLRACLHWNLMPTISSLKEAFLCHNLADGTGRAFKVQLKFDTGMTRLGCAFEEASKLEDGISQLRNLNLRGIYSHLALADCDSPNEIGSVTSIQKKRFEEVFSLISLKNNEYSWHLSNSAGTLISRDLHYNMVRVGLALYGYNPLNKVKCKLELESALSVKARVTLVRDVKSGVGVSYGHSFITSRPSRLAIIGIGYADGVSRALSGKIGALFNGIFLPQVGAITMDQLIVDATDCPEISEGSIVTMLGQDGDKCITPLHWSDASGSIPWEVLCGFKHRLPRVVI